MGTLCGSRAVRCYRVARTEEFCCKFEERGGESLDSMRSLSPAELGLAFALDPTTFERRFLLKKYFVLSWVRKYRQTAFFRTF